MIYWFHLITNLGNIDVGDGCWRQIVLNGKTSTHMVKPDNINIPKIINLPSPTVPLFCLSKQTPLGGGEGRLIFLGMLIWLFYYQYSLFFEDVILTNLP